MGKAERVTQLTVRQPNPINPLCKGASSPLIFFGGIKLILGLWLRPCCRRTTESRGRCWSRDRRVPLPVDPHAARRAVIHSMRKNGKELYEREINSIIGRAPHDTLPPALQSTPLAAIRRKLAAGEPVCARCLGGSVTLGAKLAADDTPFPAQFFRLVGGAYPHAAHDFDSFGGGGFGSKFYGSCICSYVPTNCDLVVLDVAVNDITGSDAVRQRQLERAVGSLLAPPLNVTAILLMNWINREDIDKQGSSSSFPLRNARIAAQVASGLGAASLDMRPLVMLSPSANTTGRFWAADGRHPSADGHALISRALARAVLGARREAHGRHAGAAAASLRRAAAGGSARQYSSLCFVGERLGELVEGPAPAGWSMANEGVAGRPKWGFVSRTLGASLALRLDRHQTASAVRAWGNRTIRHDASAPVLKLFNFKNDVFFVELGYLASYGNYGEFHVACLPKATCRCKKAMPWWPFPNVRTRMENARASVWGSTVAKVQGGIRCLAELQVVVTTRNSSKVKILGVNLHPFNFPF